MRMASVVSDDGTLGERTPLVRSETLESHSSGLNMAIHKWLGQISVPVYVLVILFAMSSWIDVNGLWVELPLLVNVLPEGWNLPSYLAVIIQVANIGPFAYTVANRLAPNKVKEWPVIYIIIITGATACLLLAFCWKTTSFIGGSEHSTTLIALTALLAIVDCTSSVVFLPYMAVFKPQYMTALYVGEGFSGLIPGLVGLVQSVGAEPECVNKTVHNATTGINHTEHHIYPVYPPPVFSVEVFFFFLFAMLVVSGVSFSLLHWLPYCRRERMQVQLTHVESSHFHYTQAGTTEPTDAITGSGGTSATHRSAEVNGYPHSSTEPLQRKNGAAHPTQVDSSTVATNRDDDGRDPQLPHLSKTKFLLLLVLTAWLNSLTNGIIASTGSFSILPYGNLAYSLAVRLSAVANPLACVLALFVVCHSVTIVCVLTSVGTALAGYQIYLAATSPIPPLVGTVLGQFLAVTTAISMTAVFSYVKVTIASILRFEGRKALLWCGVITQAGAFIGAVTAFILVNVLNLFTSIPPCSQ